jgi:hypothetical protein
MGEFLEAGAEAAPERDAALSTDAAAVAVALDRSRGRKRRAGADPADLFLEDQRRLLHLKWGEALARQGRADEAKAQFAAAARLDLTAAERAELAAQKA